MKGYQFLPALFSIIFLVGCNPNIRNNNSSKSPQLGNKSDSTELPESVSTQSPTSQSSNSDVSGVTVAESAKLSSGQVQNLLLLAEYARGVEPGRDFKVIVPTYIPDGFSIENVEIYIKPKEGRDLAAPGYSIDYRHSINKTCSFKVSVTSGGWGDGGGGTYQIKVFSEALGILILDIIESDRYRNSPYIKLRGDIVIRYGRGYSFKLSGCDSLKIQEVIKVVESFQYMDTPKTQARLLEVIEKDGQVILSKFDFPLDSCGDSAPTAANVSWYPVFLDGVRSGDAGTYCRDSVSMSKNVGFTKVQVGSFTSYEKASEFAKAIGGRVGKPDK